MDLKEVFGHSCIVFLIHCSIRFSTRCFPHIKILFFQITLDIYVKNSPSCALPGLRVWIGELCKLKIDSVISILKSKAIVSQR
uniref:Uncharacterized protein n=1 Tax=Arundo donax TaxID=35708 RepID=A0A0A9DL71_ARUDO